MRYLLIVLLFVTCMGIGCEKEEYDIRKASFSYCNDNMVFTCDTDVLGDYYFSGTIKGDDFCLPVTPNGNSRSYGVATQSITSTANPTFSSSTPINGTFYTVGIRPPQRDVIYGKSEDFAPFITINSPLIPDSIVRSGQYYIETYFKKGLLPLRYEGMPETEGFSFSIAWSCVHRPGYDYYRQKEPAYIPSVAIWLSPYHSRTRNDRLELVDIEKIETGEVVEYYLTFHVSCDLLHFGNDIRGTFVGRLENGIFKTKIEIPW